MPVHGSLVSSDMVLGPPLTVAGFARPDSAIPGLPPKQTCYDPWNPAIGRQLAGRSEEFDRLEMAVNQSHSVNLVGDHWIGKTSFLMTWAEDFKNLSSITGREVLFLNGEGPEGENISTFVQAITGQVSPENPDLAANELLKWAQFVQRPRALPLIIVDDADKLMSRIHHRFWQRLRGMLDKLIIFFGTRVSLDLLYEDNKFASPLANRMGLVQMALLEKDEAERLVNRGALHWQKGDAELLRHWCGNHPFFLQLLGSHLAQARIEARSSQSALDLFVIEAKPCLDQLKQTWSPREQERLHKVAQGLDVGHWQLQNRGLLTNQNQPFGHVLLAYLRDEL